MSVNITYFAHSTSVDNLADVSSGWNDAPLSELGTRQSEELRNQTDGRKFDAVFCSDFQRAAETARIAFSGKAPIIIDKRLRECNYGVYNGGPSNIVEPMCEQRTTQKFPEGESYDDVKDRVAEFLEFLGENYDGQTVAVVTHKAPNLALEVLLNNKTWEQAFAGDWRNHKAWQPGWNYIYNK
jgi:broad specificity phosphatase PhoE